MFNPIRKLRALFNCAPPAPAPAAHAETLTPGVGAPCGNEGSEVISQTITKGNNVMDIMPDPAPESIPPEKSARAAEVFGMLSLEDAVLEHFFPGLESPERWTITIHTSHGVGMMIDCLASGEVTVTTGHVRPGHAPQTPAQIARARYIASIIEDDVPFFIAAAGVALEVLHCDEHGTVVDPIAHLAKLRTEAEAFQRDALKLIQTLNESDAVTVGELLGKGGN